MGDIDLQRGLILYLVLLGSLSVHEWAHAIVADRIGDPTPRSQGRVTLNPISHIDPIGTVLLPMVMIFIGPGIAIFGWGKPVPVDPRNFSKPVRDDILVSMAGPFSNLIIILLTAVVTGILLRFGADQTILDLAVLVISINAILILFNLIPIPPLDGSHVMKHLVGMKDETYYSLAQYGFIAILILINIPFFRSFLGAGIQSVLILSFRLVEIIAGM